MKNSKKMISLLAFAFLFANVSFAQSYHRVKVTLLNGVTFVGKNASITKESVSFMEGNKLIAYDLSEVSIIQAKRGTASKWGLGFGGGCLGVAAIAGIAAGSEGMEETGITVGQYIASTALWVGVFAGIGFVIGSLTDNYQNVYLNTGRSSLIERFELNLTSNQITNYNLTLSYRF